MILAARRGPPARTDPQNDTGRTTGEAKAAILVVPTYRAA